MSDALVHTWAARLERASYSSLNIDVPSPVIAA